MGSFSILFTGAIESGIAITDYFSIAKDVATIIALFGGLYLGHKGIKKYLLEDIIRERVASIQDANSQARIISKKIIREINDKDDIRRPADEYDVIHIKSLTRRLVNTTSEASSEIYSLAFLLHETTKNIKLKISKEIGNTSRHERRMAADFYSLVVMTCYKINFFASNIIDIPESRRTVKFHEIRKELRGYLNKTGFAALKDFKTGLDLNPNSATPLIFFSILRKSTYDYIFSRRFFNVLKDNTPLFYNLHINQIYFPLILDKLPKVDQDSLFGEDKLHLIHIQKKETKLGDNHGRVFYEFTYSNLNPVVRFVDSVCVDTFKEEYFDSFIQKNQTHFAHLIKKFTLLGEESIKVECDLEDVKAYYKSVEKEIKRELKALKKQK